MEYFADPLGAMSVEAEGFRRPGASGHCWVWTTAPCLVVPRTVTRRPGFEVVRECLLERGFPVVERGSGGGIVPQGPGILNVSVTVPIYPQGASTGLDYAWLCAPLCALVHSRGRVARLGAVPGSFCDGAHNVVVDNRKLAGTAQRRGSTSALLHAVVLVNPDLGPALAAIRMVRTHLGDPVPLRDDAHVSLADLSESMSDPTRVAREIQMRMDDSLASRRL